ncbi:MAG: hypothetical protein FJ196_00810 [Gammaproteobacteria bacterium]|nr:hypothetical protein [Gammaproteobacteria bacterium]
MAKSTRYVNAAVGSNRFIPLFGVPHVWGRTSSSKVRLAKFNAVGRTLALGAISVGSLAQQLPALTEVGGHCSCKTGRRGGSEQGPHRRLDNSITPEETGKRDSCGATPSLLDPDRPPKKFGDLQTNNRFGASLVTTMAMPTAVKVRCGFPGRNWAAR